MRIPEAHWCCTMRGAEGLYRMAESLVFERDGDIYWTAFVEGDYALGARRATVRTAWPYAGQIEVRLSGDWAGRTLRLCLPEATSISLDGVPLSAMDQSDLWTVTLPDTCADGAILSISCTERPCFCPPVGKFTDPRARTLWLGPVLLASADLNAETPALETLVPIGDGAFETPSGTRFEPISRAIRLGENRAMKAIFFQSRGDA